MNQNKLNKQLKTLAIAAIVEGFKFDEPDCWDCCNLSSKCAAFASASCFAAKAASNCILISSNLRSSSTFVFSIKKNRTKSCKQ